MSSIDNTLFKKLLSDHRKSSSGPFYCLRDDIIFQRNTCPQCQSVDWAIPIEEDTDVSAIAALDNFKRKYSGLLGNIDDYLAGL